jgi:hypothetical protein
MPWLERPAAVYMRYEVVVHRIDEPMIVRQQIDGRNAYEVIWEVREVRMMYVFDAHAGKWHVGSIDMMGYRRGARSASSWEKVPGRPTEVVRLAEKYQPDWVPDPSKARLHLPAEDVWDECASAHGGNVAHPENPYRGE